MARPSKFKPEFVDQVRKLCQLGATDKEIAEFFDVSERTINTWKLESDEFLQALKSGKESSDARVERSLHHRAVGYSYPAVKIFQFQGAPVEVPYVEHVPPDTTACIFWLKNRKQAEWRDKQELVHKGAVRIVASDLDEQL